MEKKPLSQILRVGLGKSASPKVGKDRRPIVAAEIGEGITPIGCGISRGADAAPSRRGKGRQIHGNLRPGLGDRCLFSAKHHFGKSKFGPGDKARNFFKKSCNSRGETPEYLMGSGFCLRASQAMPARTPVVETQK